MTRYNLKDINKSNKKLGPATTVIFHNPISDRLVWFLSNYTYIKPNQITVLSLLIGFFSIYYIVQDNFLYSAILFQIFYILDCADGKLARLLKKKSIRGDILDHFGGDILLATLSFFYLIQIGSSISLHILLVISPPFLISFNNSINFYFKYNLLKPSVDEKRFNLQRKKSSIRKFVESKGIYFRIDNTESIHFIYSIAPLFFYYNFSLYAYISLSLSVVLLLIAIMIRIRTNMSKINN